MNKHSLGNLFLLVVDRILVAESDELCKELEPRLKKVYMEIKRNNVRITKQLNGGVLPHPNALGWKEYFWERKFQKVVNHCISLKKIWRKEGKMNEPMTMTLEERLRKLEKLL